MWRYLFTLMLALSTPSIAVAAEGGAVGTVIYESDNTAWTASHLAGGTYVDDNRKWVAARVQYVVGGSTVSSSFAIRGCESGLGDGIAWPLEKPSKVEQLSTVIPEIRFPWPDAGFYNTFSMIAVQLCRLAEADGWFGR